MNCDTLYTADYLITQNAGRYIIEKGALAVSGSQILCTGHSDMLKLLYPEARLVELGHAVLMPGLINAHTHISMSAMRGYSDDKALMDWLTQDIFPIEAKLSPEIIGMAARFSMAEMIRTGTTAFYDMYMHENAIFQATDEMGMRAVLGESFTQYFPNIVAPNKDAHFDLIRAQAEAWSQHPRIRLAITPHAPYTTNPELLKEGYQLAEELGALFGMHLAETKQEVKTCLENFGKRPIAYCKELGILGKTSSFFHVIEANEEEWDMLAESGSSVVHNPCSNMKLASGCAPISSMIARGIPVGLGSDGPASNNAQNMMREMNIASLMQKLVQQDPSASPAQEVLDMATLGSASALNEPLIGCLEPGMKADFIALDLKSPNMQPIHNIVSNIVFAASGMETILTVVDGKELYRDGKYLHCDYDALLAEMKNIQKWVQKSK